MAVSERLIEQTTRHQVHLERLKSGEANQWTSFLQQIDRSIRERLAKHDLTAFSRSRLERLVSSVNAMLDEIYGEYRGELNIHLQDLADYEAGFEARSLAKATVDTVEFVVPASTQVHAAIMAQPLSVRGADGGKLLTAFIRDWTTVERKRVSHAIRQGFFEGKTTAQILTDIRGTQANAFRDGILAVNDRHVRTMVRTAVQHVASVARFETWNANSDFITGYQWISTLDSRTSQQCRSLDGQEFKLGEGPKPPIHPNCRSTTVPALSSELDFLREDATRASKDGYVDADQTYYEWLKKQPYEFQVDALGPARAKLFRDGGLSASEFARLNLGRNFRPLTLDEMKKLEPHAFNRALTSPAGPISTDPAVVRMEARAYVTSNGRKHGGEYAYGVDLVDGNLLIRKKGGDRSVSFSTLEVERIMRAKDVVLYHNHPSGTSLSKPDLIFGSSTNLKEIVAFSTQGQGEYIASHFKSPDVIASAYGQAEKYIERQIRPRFMSGEFNVGQANALHVHFINAALDRVGVIKYKAPELSRNTSQALSIADKQFDAWLEEFRGLYTD